MLDYHAQMLHALEEQQRIAAINRLLYQTSSTENDLDSAQKKQELVAYVYEYHKQHKQRVPCSDTKLQILQCLRVFPKYLLLFLLSGYSLKKLNGSYVN